MVTNSNDIFSLIGYVFDYLQSETTRNIHRKYRLAVQACLSKEFESIDALINELLIINPYEYIDWLEIWKREFEHTKLDSIVFCYVFLLKVDEIICVFNKLNKPIESVGPLTGNDEYYLYFKPPEAYFSTRLATGKIRRGRQTVEYGVNSINYDFKNFEVIKNNQLNEYTPVVKKYNHKYCFGDVFQIGFAFISKNAWFAEEKDDTTKEITVRYEPSTFKTQNTQMFNLLTTFDKMGVDVAVFPELAMNPTTEKEIQRFILSTKFNNLKLVFLGSVWNNNRNEAVLINSEGSILLREQKKIPYSKFCKDQDCYYTESIVSDREINFIDLDGLGRIAYLICADFNDLCLNTICSIMHTDFMFVSAFSNSTDTMLKTAENNAEVRATTTVLCNACAARQEGKKTLSAFTVVPEVDEHRLVANIIDKYEPCSSELNCKICVKKSIINKI